MVLGQYYQSTVLRRKVKPVYTVEYSEGTVLNTPISEFQILRNLCANIIGYIFIPNIFITFSGDGLNVFESATTDNFY